MAKKKLQEGYCRGSTGQHYTEMWVNFVKLVVPAKRQAGIKGNKCPLSIVNVPFKRIAMDIVGPLARSIRGSVYFSGL